MKKIVLLAASILSSAIIAQETISMDGSTTVGPIAKAFAGYYMKMNKEVKITVSESGSGNGAKSLINGTCDIANMSRAMKEKEFTVAAAKKLQPTPHVVAYDGIAMILHPSNPVKALTMAQVKDIYLGKIDNWSQVGGANRKIVVVSRDTASGTFECFHKLVMKKEKMGQVETVGSNGAARSRVATTAGAIAFVGLGYIDRTVKAIEIDAVYPEQETVANGRYPIARPLFMYTNGYPKLGTHVHRFVTLHLSKKGQEIIESIGFVPVTSY